VWLLRRGPVAMTVQVKSIKARSTAAFSKREISVLFKKARRVYAQPGFHILVAPATLSYGRILIVTSRKVGNAPTRNKIRRRLKAIFYEERLFEKQLDCIVIVKPDGARSDFTTLKNLLKEVVDRHAPKYNQ